MIELVPAEPRHIEMVALDAHEEIERKQTIDMALSVPHIRDLLAHYARSLLREDRVLATFGVWPVWPGVGRAWSMISPEARARHPKSLYKAVRVHLDAIELRDNLHRIEATVRYGHPSAHGWIRHLGFSRYEGLMVNYGFGGVGDFHLYARIRPWESKP